MKKRLLAAVAVAAIAADSAAARNQHGPPASAPPPAPAAHSAQPAPVARAAHHAPAAASVPQKPAPQKPSLPVAERGQARAASPAKPIPDRAARASSGNPVGATTGSGPVRATTDNRHRGIAGARAQEAPAKPLPSHAEPELLSPGGKAASRPAANEVAARTTGTGSVVGLLADERAFIGDVIRRDDLIARAPECRYEEQVDYVIGSPFPRTTRVCRFPDEVQARVPQSRRYRYLVNGNGIVLIDPNDHRIVEVIE